MATGHESSGSLGNESRFGVAAMKRKIAISFGIPFCAALFLLFAALSFAGSGPAGLPQSNSLRTFSVQECSRTEPAVGIRGDFAYPDGALRTTVIVPESLPAGKYVVGAAPGIAGRTAFFQDEVALSCDYPTAWETSINVTRLLSLTAPPPPSALPGPGGPRAPPAPFEL